MDKSANIDGPVYKGVKAENGDFVVVKLEAVVKGDISKIKGEQKTALSRILASNTGAKYYQFYLDFIKSNAEIEKQ